MTKILRKADCIRVEARGEDNAGTSIYFYGSLDGWEKSGKDIAETLESRDQTKPLNVYVNSMGGDVFQALAINSRVDAWAGKVVCHIDGLCASAATLIAFAADKVVATESSLFMFHAPESGVFGNKNKLEERGKLLDRVSNSMRKVYSRRVSDTIINGWFSSETWYSADEARELGIVDDVIKDTSETPQALAVAMAQLRTEFPINRNEEPLMSQAAEDKPEVEQPAKASPEDAGSAEVKAKAPDPVPVMTVNTVNPDDGETRRIARITAIFGGKHDDERVRCISQGVTEQEAANAYIEAERASQKPVTQPRASVTQTSEEKFFIAAQAVVEAKSGLASKEEREKLYQNEFSSYSLYDMAKTVAEFEGFSIKGKDREAVVAASFGQGVDRFPKLLENVARKSLFLGYEEVPEYYNRITRTESLTDFKEIKKAGLGSFSELTEIGEFTEYEHGDVQEVGASLILSTFGRLFGLSRRAIINDDLSALSTIPRRMGRAARRRIGDLVRTALQNNTTPLEVDNKVLYHSDHNNTVSTAPSTAAFTALRTKMMTQKEIGGQPMNATPSLIVCPAAVYDAIRLVLQSETEIANSQNNSRRPNMARNFVSMDNIIADAHLDLVNQAGYYVLADPNMFDGLVLGLLNGTDEPYMERHDEFRRDGVTWKVRVDAAAKPIDYRAIYRGGI